MWILGLKGLTLCISCVCNFAPFHSGERTLCVKGIGVFRYKGVTSFDTYSSNDICISEVKSYFSQINDGDNLNSISLNCCSQATYS